MRFQNGLLALFVSIFLFACNATNPAPNATSSDPPPVQFLERGEGARAQAVNDYVALMRFFNRARTLHSVATAYPDWVPFIQANYAPRPGVEDRYHFEAVMGYIFVNPQPGTFALYACTARNGNNNYFVSVDAGCEGQLIGPRLGFVFYNPPDGNAVALYRCRLNVPWVLDHFVSQDRNCEGQIFEGWLGWARAYPF